MFENDVWYPAQGGASLVTPGPGSERSLALKPDVEGITFSGQRKHRTGLSLVKRTLSGDNPPEAGDGP
jgi:hypothetical protein